MNIDDKQKSLAEHEEIDRLADRFEREFRDGIDPSIESFVDEYRGDRRRLLQELIALEVELRQANGEEMDRADLVRRFPNDPSVIDSLFAEEAEAVEEKNLVAEFRSLWNKEPSLTSEAFAAVRDEQLSESQFRELLQEEVALRLERFGGGFLAAKGPARDPGETLAVSSLPSHVGRYEVLSLIAEGGFGTVYEARDPNLDRAVAIKTPRLDKPLDDTNRGEFEREARLICRMEHPNILPVYDFGVTTDGRPFMVVKLVKSKTLADRLDDQDLTFFEATTMVAALARALHYAHGLGVVHRDVKPKNVLLDETGHPWLTDFGLGLESPNTKLSTDSSGTPLYWSPEQAEGKSHLVDGRSDIFSLGIILYQAITHTNPFYDDEVSGIVKRILFSDVRPPRQCNDRIPKQLEDVCLRALRRDPLERYSTAADFADDLDSIPTYTPRPIDTANVQLTPEIRAVVETLSINTHEIWASRRLSEGWIVGEKRDDHKKTHPDLVPFEQLSKTEQDYDRDVVESVLKAAIALGVQIRPPSQDQ